MNNLMAIWVETPHFLSYGLGRVDNIQLVGGQYRVDSDHIAMTSDEHLYVFNSTPCICPISSLDRRVSTFLNFSGSSNTTTSKGSTANGFFFFALIWARLVIAMRGCDLRGEDFHSFSPFSVLVWSVDSTVVRLANCLEGQPALRWSNS